MTVEGKRGNAARGRFYEEEACRFLEAQGLRILCRNYRFHRQEIDIVARDGDWFCFVEVKARSADRYGYGFQAVDRRKQENIRRVAEAYLLERGLSVYSTPCRFDVVSFDGGRIRYFRNAF